MKKEKQIEIRSNEVQEILGGVPAWLIRYGVLLIIVVFFLLLIATWAFRYPDVIRSRIIVTTERPPAPIISRASGKIDRLFVEDNQKVTSGTILGIIQNPVVFDDIKYLKAQLKDIRSFLFDFDFNIKLDFRKDLQLGDIQNEYSFFVKKYNDYKVFINLNYYPKLNKSLEQQKRMSRIYYDRLYTQKQIFQNELNLSRNQFNRDSSLFVNGVIASQGFEKSKAEMLAKKNNYEGARTLLAETQMEILAFDQKIIENQKNYTDQKSNNELDASEAFQNLVASINEWDLNYVLTAPVDGMVTFNSFWSETQNVKRGDRVLTILPENPGELVGRVELPIRGSGKVKTGLDVKIKFENYPYMEYGMVSGKIKNISRVPENNFYMVEIEFPQGLITNYGNKLELQNEITGTAEIITEKLRLIQRIFNPLKALWKERVVD